MHVHPLIQLLIGLAIAGTLVWAFNTFWTTIDPKFKAAINAIVGIALFVFCLYCADEFFGWGWFAYRGHR